MNALSQRAVAWVASQSCEIVLLVLVLGLVWRASRGASAHWRYLLGLLVLVKCVIPSFVPLAVPEPAAVLVQAMSSPTETASEGQGEQPSLLRPESVGFVPWHARFVLSSLCALVWGVGAAAMVGLAGLKALGIQATLRRTRVEPDLELECEFLELGRRLGLRRRPKLCLLASAGQPFVWGICRGCIYLPATFPRQGKLSERQVVLAHELAHVLRWDALVNCFQVLVQAVFWFHPAVWWLNSRLRQERENCCDEMAIAALRVEATDYGAALVEHLVARFSPAVPPSSLAMSGKAKELEDRLRVILIPDRGFRKWPGIGAVLAVLAGAVLVLPTGIEASRGSLVTPETGARPRAWSFEMTNNWAAQGRLFAELPLGDQRLAGVRWLIKGVSPIPSNASVRLKVQGPFSKLHLLHAVDGAAEPGTTVGRVRLHYSDGSMTELPIRYGDHLQDCRFSSFSPVRDPDSVMAWTGGNSETRAAGRALRLYRTTLTNPRPALQLEQVEYAAQTARPVLVLAAVATE